MNTELLDPAAQIDIDRTRGDFRYDEKHEFDAGTGLTHDTIDYIVDVKGEPDWIREFRHKALDTFLAKQFLFDRELNDYKAALARVESLIKRAIEQLSVDDDDQAQRLLASAKRVYDLYQKSVISNRQRFPDPFPQMLRRIVHEYGGLFSHESYLHVCEKLSIEPLKVTASQPTTATAS